MPPEIATVVNYAVKHTISIGRYLYNGYDDIDPEIRGITAIPDWRFLIFDG
jgi:hypothetical protein